MERISLDLKALRMACKILDVKEMSGKKSSEKRLSTSGNEVISF